MIVGVHPLAGFDKVLHYRVPEAMRDAVQVGSLVRVPILSALRLGLVVGVGIVAPTIIADYHFSGRRWTLTGLTAAHRIVHIVLMSCVLGAFNQYT